MRLAALEPRPVVLERTEPFRIATGVSTRAENVLVKIIADDGSFGWGAAARNSVTKETTESILKAVVSFSKRLAGREFSSPAEIFKSVDRTLAGNHAAKAAVDIAAHDLFSKSDGLPLFEYLRAYAGSGKPPVKRDRIATDITIGIMGKNETVKHALHWQRQGFRALNIKVGLDMESDIKRIEAVRDAVGKEMLIRVDANQGYSVRQSIEFAEMIEPFDIEFIEQPVRAQNLDGLKEVTEKSRIPIAADEAVRSVADAMKTMDAGCADIINVKLLKFGGITEALRICRHAEMTSTKLKVGCYGEGRITIAAALHFALSQERVCFADLDSWFSLKGDCARGGMKFKDGYLLPFVKKPGLGISVHSS